MVNKEDVVKCPYIHQMRRFFGDAGGLCKTENQLYMAQGRLLWI